MKKILTIILLLATVNIALANSPKAVIKDILKEDNLGAWENLNRIPVEERNGLYLLAKAMYDIIIDGDSGSNMLIGYKLFSDNYDMIKNHEDLPSLMKSCNTTIESIKSILDINSAEYVYKSNSVEVYEEYIPMARRALHPELETIEYKYAILCQKDDVCYNFLKDYPTSAYKTEVRTLLGKLLAAGDEHTIKQFITDFPDYEDIATLKARLTELQYARVSQSSDLKQIRIFVDEHPEHPQVGALKQKMADIEFPTLGDSYEELKRFRDYYGDSVTQSAAVNSKLLVYDIINSGDIKMIISYVKTNGYDKYYSQFMRSLYRNNGYYILTPNINEVSLIRFADNRGKVGYMDFNGQIVIAPQFDSGYTTSYFEDAYSNTMAKEFMLQRSYAAVCLNGKWGVINTKGEFFIEPKYVDIKLDNHNVYGCVLKDTSDIVWFDTTTYDYTGAIIRSNEQTFLMEADFQYNKDVDIKPLPKKRRITYVSPRYGYIKRENTIINTAGESNVIVDKVIKGVTENIALCNCKENGTDRRYFVNLDRLTTSSRIKPCDYDDVGKISCGLIAVRKGDKVGFINEQLDEVIPLKYGCDATLPMFTCGVAAVKDDSGRFILINTAGERVSELSYQQLTALGSNGRSSNPGLFIEQSESGSNARYRIIDTDGSPLTPWIEKYPTVVDNCAIVVGAEQTTQHYFYKL